MTFGDALGWVACLMTLVTFAQRRMVPLRIAAILANFFFIGYGALGHYLPVLALHLTLPPVNGRRRFSRLVGGRSQSAASAPADTMLPGHDHVGSPGDGIRRHMRAAAHGGVPKALHHLIENRVGFGARR